MRDPISKPKVRNDGGRHLMLVSALHIQGQVHPSVCTHVHVTHRNTQRRKKKVLDVFLIKQHSYHGKEKIFRAAWRFVCEQWTPCILTCLYYWHWFCSVEGGDGELLSLGATGGNIAYSSVGCAVQELLEEHSWSTADVTFSERHAVIHTVRVEVIMFLACHCCIVSQILSPSD